jgi:hypothetical protein
MNTRMTGRSRLAAGGAVPSSDGPRCKAELIALS